MADAVFNVAPRRAARARPRPRRLGPRRPRAARPPAPAAPRAPVPALGGAGRAARASSARSARRSPAPGPTVLVWTHYEQTGGVVDALRARGRRLGRRPARRRSSRRARRRSLMPDGRADGISRSAAIVALRRRISRARRGRRRTSGRMIAADAAAALLGAVGQDGASARRADDDRAVAGESTPLSRLRDVGSAVARRPARLADAGARARTVPPGVRGLRRLLRRRAAGGCRPAERSECAEGIRRGPCSTGARDRSSQPASAVEHDPGPCSGVRQDADDALRRSGPHARRAPVDRADRRRAPRREVRGLGPARVARVVRRPRRGVRSGERRAR